LHQKKDLLWTDVKSHNKNLKTVLLLTGSMRTICTSIYSLAGSDLDLNPTTLATEKRRTKKTLLRFEIRTSAGTGIKQV